MATGDRSPLAEEDRGRPTQGDRDGRPPVRSLVPPSASPAAMEAWQTSLKTGGAYDSVHRIRGTDDTYRWFQCKATATRNENR
ncbi:PAS domain-containing protein [Paraburkholderia aspalathi]|uniref:PAS domain-containing protein n=1 Tax=Paraburkholderia aspalathi TaxID=1324617 RepID=UPI0038BD77C9